MLNNDPYLPKPVRITRREQDSEDIITLHLEFINPMDSDYQILPGQFNMLYAYGCGEIPISVVSDVEQPGPLAHTIRRIGMVTEALFELNEGDQLGLRGPFGYGWPLEQLQGKDILIITGGLGNVPLISAIDYLVKYHQDYASIHILHGIKNINDLIYKDHYTQWQKTPNVNVHLACNQPQPGWHHGLVTKLIETLPLNDYSNAAALICGPRIMMHSTAEMCLQKGMLDNQILLSLERNMQCGLGHCGHCQCGAKFVCQDGPVFSWQDISPAMNYGF